jgi:hypothetical protein
MDHKWFAGIDWYIAFPSLCFSFVFVLHFSPIPTLHGHSQSPLPIRRTALEQRRYKAPLQPKVGPEGDTSNFERYADEVKPTRAPVAPYYEEFKDF